jgi:dienelactone hydrolase
MRLTFEYVVGLAILLTISGGAYAQALGQPDRGEPGDRMIQDYLERVAVKIQNSFAADLASVDDWKIHRPLYRDEYFYMLGLSPLPERTNLKATITGSHSGDGFVVDMLHYQSVPGLYVTANLFRPATAKAGQRLPAVLYVCGHSGRGRDGNKTAFQSHGIWFARHGYVCLVVDTLQLGEIAAIHHGTYRENRWWWHSRGYTPAGVECWNGVRGIDYLVSRPDVDPESIAVTGISGGGAATFWIAAADERVKVAVPVSGMADLVSYVPNRVINGHCDCMFLYNTFEWPWVRIASLVAPRPLLFINSDNDAIFPMDANERVINQLERVYSLYGAGDRVDSVVSIGGHAYRRDIRQAAFRFINTWLKDDSRPVGDSEVDIVEDPPAQVVHPIEPGKLRAFATDADIPADQLNTSIDRHFVPMAQVAVPGEGQFDVWRNRLLAELRRVAFRALPERVPPGKMEEVRESPVAGRLETEPGIFVRLESIARPAGGAMPKRVLLFVQTSGKEIQLPAWVETIRQPTDHVYRCEPRGTGDTRWTTKNPPNTVQRSHVLVGRTVDAGRVYDVIATTRYLRDQHKEARIEVIGEGAGAILAAYAALWDTDIDSIVVHQPIATHMDSAAPQFLNVLRVADIPDLLGMLAPRGLTIISDDEVFQKTAAIYKVAGAADRLTIRKQQ